MKRILLDLIPIQLIDMSLEVFKRNLLADAAICDFKELKVLYPALDVSIYGLYIAQGFETLGGNA